MSKKVCRQIQHKAILELFTGKPVSEIAEMYEISPQTLNRWLRSEKGNQMYSEAQRELYQVGLNVLIEGRENAAWQLRGLISSPDTPSAVKTRAIEILFKYSQPGLDNTDYAINYLTSLGYTVSIDGEAMVKQLQSKGVPVAMIEAGSDSDVDSLKAAINVIESDMLNL
jgi:hypothetical protein